MSEEFVGRHEHRADMAELRLEITQQLATLDKRTELIAQDLVSRTDRLAQDLGALRRETGEWRTEMRQDMRELRDEMRQFRTTTQRQLWVMIGIVATAVIGALVKLLFFP